jgi:hypothetical protein
MSAGGFRGLGLDKCKGKFRDHNIDLDVLPQLTADDPKDIGVSAVGDRRRLLAAIAALEGDASSGCSLPRFQDNLNFGYGPCFGRSGFALALQYSGGFAQV